MITWSDRWDCSCQYLLSIVSLNWERPGSGIARGKFWEQGLSSCCTLCWLMSWQMSGCPGKMEGEEAWCAVFEHRYWDSYSYHQVNPSSYSTWLFDACSFVPCSYSQAPSTFFRPFFSSLLFDILLWSHTLPWIKEVTFKLKEPSSAEKQEALEESLIDE